ncbi:hypothetical protein CPC08DRAFT_821184 [Agrocybe pediades]|nr:hypothetical protein CPC08DRAFT_821184 [Agrocybe pediades]
MFFNALFTLALTGFLGSHVEALAMNVRQVPCVTLPYGSYTIASEETGWLLQPYHHARSPPAIISYEEPPAGQLGVWTLTAAPQNSYFLRNVGENLPVATLDYGVAPQPYTAPESVGAVAFAIQCAGNGTYVVKLPTADAVWTAPPGAWVKLYGANGSIIQRFRFTAV